MPPHPSPEFSLTRDSLNPEASSYAENLEAQIQAIYHKHGAQTWEEFQRLAQSPKSPISLETINKLHNPLQQLDHIREIGKLPETEFPYNETEARRLGLEKLEIRAYPEAQRLIEQVINKNIDIETEAGKTQFVNEWNAACPDLPMPCVLQNTQCQIVTSLDEADLTQSNFWYITQLKDQRIVSHLEDYPQRQFPHFDQEEILLVDSWLETDYDAPEAEQKHKSKLLLALLGQESTVNIKRRDLDAALWQGDPANRIPTEKHKQLLQQLGVNPNKCELRLIRQDEYARLAQVKAWGQHNLCTHFDHYCMRRDGTRLGLFGRLRGRGGLADVNWDSRSLVAGFLASRLVLGRKGT